METAAVRTSLPRALELFTGSGGLALGTHAAGFRHSALVEWNRDACATLRENVRERSIRGISHWKIIEGDIRKFDYAPFSGVDLVAGGPPCQPFSIGGKHQGYGDDRDMIPEFIRALQEVRPRAFLFENVKGLTRNAFQNYLSHVQLQMIYPDIEHRRGEDWGQHLERLEDLHTQGRRKPGYKVVMRVLNAADYGVPQTRERIFIVGLRSDLGINWHFPTGTHSQDRLLYDQWVSGEYWERHAVSRPDDPPPRSISRIDRLADGPAPEEEAWRTLRDAICDLPEPEPDQDVQGIRNHRLQPGARAYIGHTGSSLDAPSKTLKAGVHGVPGGENMIAFEDSSVRYLSVREAARVQTFPDSWRFAGAWSETMRQLGNAVPRLLAERLARSIADRLREAR